MTNEKVKEIEENFKTNLKLLIGNFDQCRKLSDFVPIRFGGNAIYYHHKTLVEAKTGFLEDEHIAMIYKVLDAWGMNSRSTKLLSLKKFTCQIRNYEHKRPFEDMKSKYGKKRIDELKDTEIEEIVTWMFDNEIKGINKKSHKKTKTQIVLLSKTFHHIIPNIIPPIDREYSLRFMTWRHENFNAKDVIHINPDEKRLARIFIEGMRDFFKNTKEGQALIQTELVKPNSDANIIGAFNTSLPKIFDNLIIAFVLLHRVKLSVQQVAASMKAK